MRSYSIKTHEEVISLQSGIQTIRTIKQNSIESHLKTDYRFMHIGLVQVAVKPLLKKDINVPIFMALIDKKTQKIQIFLVGRHLNKCL